MRTDGKGNLQESTPCIRCMNVIKDLNIKRVIHSIDGGNICIKNPPDYSSEHITMGQEHMKLKIQIIQINNSNNS